MKTLLILRHGKSSWASSDLADHDRPLKPRGEKAARRIGREIRKRGLALDLIVSSTARRARETAALAAEAAGYDGEITLTQELYLSGAKHQLATVAEHAGTSGHRKAAGCVMMVGHNPTLEDVVEHLTGEDVRLTTGNLARIELDIPSWDELPDAAGRLDFVLRPRELAATS